MELEGIVNVRTTPSRHEKSLGLLTRKFVSLLQEAKDGVLDLKVAAESLAVKQKRRIYDITNVLEGVGLIEKKNKNIIQWRGQNRGSQSQELLEQIRVLKAQISDLEVQEKELDEQKSWLEENIEQLNCDPDNCVHKFVTHEDICNSFSGDTLLAVVAPSGTQLEVPLPELGKSGQKKYQVNLRSQSAPIQVMLINRDSGSRVPVAFPVPPTDDTCLMPTPPSTPASLQRFSLLNCVATTSNPTSSCCSQDSISSDQQMVLPDLDEELTPSSTPVDVPMEFHSESAAVLEQHQIDLEDPEFQSVPDVSSLLRLSTGGESMRDDREGAGGLIDELMSANDIDYSFNLDDGAGVCDLFDVQILNY
ncbi:transcription factor E2F5 isoform X1 [Fundulus heteroclitus]|uniref:transcription factor E2F5 isoform X1 n=1 Tax=Fundulus heteroclitus TaxID=8078 RepID=UPI00165BF12A|nr:transcription factor E2F5 isoform X1 [Fundulus heteroclitus]